ncbi:hypothetical protein WI58_17715 [Burkholderia cepacia]|uniref:hypothetical protein n=1 Tax=Burkholderia cepacia TaxID=292 RepID=UPI00075C280B|nr:hypothetical protein [Burkholderia cepacia]KVA68674.1 hypothetical protein WI49_07540 [Burkholderia cepacia]KVA69090.1 hypothetical protein WI48_29250 [Burkholderia cepacia]KVA83458.1 hypothetical protein WI50_19075 [Burkholderia cepacia]KVA95431.1 hypothetical protein WI52_34365 [Burkholderia cepacia]KVA96926.1 hypothetical protein WI51_33365 [Burkholderia cepacia]
MALTWAGTPSARLAESIRVSAESWALLIDGQIEALFGLVRYPMANVPWMRCSAAVAGHTRELLSHGRAWLDGARGADVPLANTVASNNAEAMTMLEHLGFVIGDVAPNQGPPGSFRFFYEAPRHV